MFYVLFKGNSKVAVMRDEYYIPKTTRQSFNYYYNNNKKEGRIGRLHRVGVDLFDAAKFNLGEIDPFYSYRFSHFVVDDNSSYCLPFLERGNNCKYVVLNLLCLQNINNIFKHHYNMHIMLKFYNFILAFHKMDLFIYLTYLLLLTFNF